MGDFSSESLEDLQAKLKEYRSSLTTVNNALESDPSEPQLLRLKKDLLEVISLTEDLVKLRKTDLYPTDDVYKDQKRFNDSQKEDRKEAVSPQGNTSVVSSSLVGRTCLATVSGNKKFGEIVQIKKSQNISTGDKAASSSVVIRFYGKIPTQAELSANLVQLLPILSNVAAGTQCQAIASEDGRLHSCIIEEILKDGEYRVVFIGSEKKENLKPDRIHIPHHHHATHKSSHETSGEQVKEQKKRKIKEIITPGGYRIPEYLQTKSTDSQHQIQAKRRKIQMLKKKQRKDNVEEEAKARQSSWLNHNRRVLGAGTSKLFGATKESIFCTSSNPDGRVGVTNSGRGMTACPKRERPVYEEFDDS